ncbi:nitroreductase family protein [Pandoraea commovens]|uniref:Putative NAD(P)H nitroreductase n=1 Tax=Pandoraea commovens TaxID=2508289 RepID=A0A5E4RT37_9BURK|nr:nitroreductase [Pandoraea commovens]UVA77283.1 nitroreductase [Pandoraea commovens]VVD65941.1 nitroreductase [Pandoraea commovens]
MGTTPEFSPPDVASRQLALEALLSRQSQWPLAAPAPSDTELNLIFDAALRAPDHGRLRPWRFVVVRDEARHDLGQALVEAAARRDPEAPAEAHEQRRRKAFAAPMIIVIAASISTATKVPEIEQLLSVGAASMNLLNAIHMLGYGGFWATGVDAYDPDIHSILDFEPNERVLGFLFVGTSPENPEVTPRPDRGDFVREWWGRSSI